MEIVNVIDNEIVNSFDTNSRGIVTIGNRKYVLPYNFSPVLIEQINTELASLPEYELHKCCSVTQPVVGVDQHKSDIIWDEATQKACRIAEDN